MLIDKEIVRKRFGKSWMTYNQHATVQREICRKMLDCLVANELTDFSEMLEVGCGSGLLTSEIMKRAMPNHYYLNDLVSRDDNGIAQIFNKYQFDNWTFLEGDAELIEFPNQLDAVVSSSTVQWFDNLPAFVRKVHLALKPRGVFAFSTFGPQNFHEIKSACNQGLSYFSVNEIQKMMDEHFEIICLHDDHVQLNFNQPIEVLRHIKNTGVNAIESTRCWNRRKLQEFEMNYPSNDRNNFVLTYNPIIIIARKK